MVGADTCGFNGYPTEILCSRWAMLGAFSPFFRNHNANGVYSPQEFYVWPDTVAVAARKAITARYKLLDYFYTALYTQSVEGTPSLNPLWFIYPEDTNTYPIEYQYFYGDALLISPVIEENATHVDMYLPNDIFYDFWTYKPVKGHGKSVNLKGVEITDIPVHIRGGRIVPMRIESAMTTTELRNKDFDIVVAPGLDGRSRGQLYLDDGDSQEQDSFSLIDLEYNKGHLQISGKFDYEETVNIAQVTLLGVDRKPRGISVNGSRVRDNRWHYSAKSSSVIVKVSLPLTKAASIQFKLDG
jgi:alpha-glucosidase